MRVFYVIYVADHRLRSVLDAIRVVADPSVSHSAHVTVRGPYTQRRNVDALSAAVAGDTLMLQPVGRFFAKGQHSVYFEASSDRLRGVWYKPDFGYNPHLTVYDGPSRSRGLQLYQLLTRHPIVLDFRVRGLEPLISNGGQSNLTVVNGIDFDLVSRIVRMPLDSSTLFELDDRRKDAVIERLCRYLSQISTGKPSVASESDLDLANGWAHTQRSRGSSPTARDRRERVEPADPIDAALQAWRFVRNSASLRSG